MQHSRPALSYANVSAGEAPRASEAAISDQTASATVSAIAHDYDTVARREPRSSSELDSNAASVATIWLVCYLVIGLGWAISRLQLDALLATVKIAVAH
jgi:hypothetical protein